MSRLMASLPCGRATRASTYAEDPFIARATSLRQCFSEGMEEAARELAVSIATSTRDSAPAIARAVPRDVRVTGWSFGRGQAWKAVMPVRVGTNTKPPSTTWDGKWVRSPAWRRCTTLPLESRSTTRSPVLRSATYTRGPAITGEPYPLADHVQCRWRGPTRRARTW